MDNIAAQWVLPARETHMFEAISTSPAAQPERHLRIVTPLASTARPAAQKPAEMRTLHLIDIENLAGGPSAADPRRALGFYMLKVGWNHSDVSYIAACGLMMSQLAFGIAEMPCRTFTANGTDGADQKLLEHADPAWIASRFYRLVIGSGDGIFADVAKQARLLGVRV